MVEENKTIGKLCSDIDENDLILLLIKQLNNFFILSNEEINFIRLIHKMVIDRLTICIENIDNKYFNRNGVSYFSPYHSGQYLLYLYFLSNESIKFKNSSLKDKIYYLNKILHAVDIYSEIELPQVFFLEHPIGTVLGRAKYGNHFFAMQGCTVGGNKGLYPVIGENVKMFSNSKVLGNSKIGDGVWIGANTYIKDTNIPDNMVVFGSFPNLILKPKP